MHKHHGKAAVLQPNSAARDGHLAAQAACARAIEEYSDRFTRASSLFPGFTGAGTLAAQRTEALRLQAAGHYSEAVVQLRWASKQIPGRIVRHLQARSLALLSELGALRGHGKFSHDTYLQFNKRMRHSRRFIIQGIDRYKASDVLGEKDLIALSEALEKMGAVLELAKGVAETGQMSRATLRSLRNRAERLLDRGRKQERDLRRATLDAVLNGRGSRELAVSF